MNKYEEFQAKVRALAQEADIGYLLTIDDDNNGMYISGTECPVCTTVELVSQARSGIIKHTKSPQIIHKESDKIM